MIASYINIFDLELCITLNEKKIWPQTFDTVATLSPATQYVLPPEFDGKWEKEVLMGTECDVRLGSQVPYDAGCLLCYDWNTLWS